MNKATCILIHTTYLNYSLLQCDNELLGACMSSTCSMFLLTNEWFLITRIKCMINIYFDVGILEHVFVWFRLFAQKMAFVNVENVFAAQDLQETIASDAR